MSRRELFNLLKGKMSLFQGWFLIGQGTTKPIYVWKMNKYPEGCCDIIPRDTIPRRQDSKWDIIPRCHESKGTLVQGVHCSMETFPLKRFQGA